MLLATTRSALLQATGTTDNQFQGSRQTTTGHDTICLTKNKPALSTTTRTTTQLHRLNMCILLPADHALLRHVCSQSAGASDLVGQGAPNRDQAPAAATISTMMPGITPPRSIAIGMSLQPAATLQHVKQALDH